MKQYNFRFYDRDSKFIEAVDRWVSNGYSIRGMVMELLAKYEGLEIPKPGDVQQLHIEINRQHQEIEKLKRDAVDTTEILISLIADMETLQRQVQQQSYSPTYPTEAVSTAHHNNRHEPPLGSQ